MNTRDIGSYNYHILLIDKVYENGILEALVTN